MTLLLRCFFKFGSWFYRRNMAWFGHSLKLSFLQMFWIITCSGILETDVKRVDLDMCSHWTRQNNPSHNTLAWKEPPSFLGLDSTTNNIITISISSNLLNLRCFPSFMSLQAISWTWLSATICDVFREFHLTNNSLILTMVTLVHMTHSQTPPFFHTRNQLTSF